MPFYAVPYLKKKKPEHRNTTSVTLFDNRMQIEYVNVYPQANERIKAGKLKGCIQLGHALY